MRSIKRVVSAAAALVLAAAAVPVSAQLNVEESGTINTTVIFGRPEENVYSDVSASDWFYDAVCAISDKGIMRGVDADRFEPHSTLSRGMAITILYRIAGSPETGAPEFADVDAAAWYADAAAWGAENGIVSGTGGGMFSPDTDVTREQLAVMIYNYMDMSGTAGADLSAYADSGSVSEWAREAMSAAVAEGIITGKSGTELAPGDNASRAEAATIFGRILKDRTE